MTTNIWTGIDPTLVRGSLASGEGILCLGLPRTGTMSLSQALCVLGIRHTHHLIDEAWGNNAARWARWVEASEAAFPSVRRGGPSGAAPPALTRADWDAFVGEYQAVTDVGALMAPQLLDAYPGARVILVERDEDKLAASWDDVFFRTMLSPWRARWLLHVVYPLIGRQDMRAVWNLIYGWVGAGPGYGYGDEAGQRLRDRVAARSREHGALVRARVPADRLLVMRLGDGWAPLCDFLGMPVPDVPFPHVNEGQALKALVELTFRGAHIALLLRAARILAPFACAGVGYWMARVGGGAKIWSRLVEQLRWTWCWV